MTGVLDIVALRSLTAIADSGGFRRAADLLHLSQSAVSQHVRRLEQACGFAVVHRRGRGLEFTAQGELLVAEARKILTAHDEALERLRLAPGPERSLVIGCTEHAADLLLPAITAQLRVAFPETSVRFRVDRGKQLNDRVDDGALDASLFIGEVRGQTARPAGELPLAWYAAPGWTPPPPSEPVPLVAIDGPCTIRRRALRTLSEHGRTASVVVESGHLAGVVQAARGGLGVALLAQFGSALQGLELRDDLPPAAAEPLYVRGREKAPEVLIEAVAAAARGLLSEHAGSG